MSLSLPRVSQGDNTQNARFDCIRPQYNALIDRFNDSPSKRILKPLWGVGVIEVSKDAVETAAHIPVVNREQGRPPVKSKSHSPI